MKKCLKITVSGKIQGVGYKEFIQKSAMKLSIEGSIQNIEDGSVVIFACGIAGKLDELIDLVYKGSSASKVDAVFVEPHIPEKSFRGVFRIIAA